MAARGFFRATAIAGGAFLATALALVLLSGPLRRSHAAVVLFIVWVALLAALRIRGTRTSRMTLLALLLAVPLGAAAGVFGGYLGDYWRRTRTPWSLLEIPLDVAPAAASAGLSRRDALFGQLRARPARDLSSFPLLVAAEVELSSDTPDAIFRLGESPPARLPEDLSWREDPFGDKTWQWLLHSMGYVVPLTERHLAGDGLRYLERAEALVLDWIDDNYLYLFKPAHPVSWHDHGTALRLRAWLPFWEAWRRSSLADARKAEQILGAIAAHAERLADPGFYTPEHNHGIDQDIALLAVSVALPEFRDSARWRELARERLGRQVEATVSPAGVHLEHSAGYHVFTLGQLGQAVRFARRHGVALEPPDLEERVRNMARNAAYMIRPDGRIVRIGDTVAWPPVGPDHPILGSFAGDDPVLRYALTRGREGEPGEIALVFEAEGYAIFRDTWGTAADFDRAFHLFFTAAAHEGCAHKQADSLSFVLHARGRPFLVDAGYHSSHSDDPERQYVIHARAHNVVLVDGDGFEGYSARIEEGRSGRGFALVRAFHDDYPLFRHTRTLVHLRPATVVVIDELRPKGSGGTIGEHDFDQLFHMDSDLQPQVLFGGSEVRAGADGEGGATVLRIRQLRDGGASTTIVRGATEPLQGWISLAHMRLDPAPVAIFRARGTEATFITLIEVIDAPVEIVPPERDEAIAERSDDGLDVTVRWRGGELRRTCRIRRSGAGGSTEAEVAEVRD